MIPVCRSHGFLHGCRFALCVGLLSTLACGSSSGPTAIVPPPGTASRAPTGPSVGPFFKDITSLTGIQHAYRNGEETNHLAILESLGGGAAVFDFDGDQRLDVFLTGGGRYGGPNKQDILGHPCKLYKNLGGMKFQDVTAQSGIDVLTHYTHGAAVGDFDRDGWPDLLVTGWGGLRLLHNQPDGKGGRRFVDVTKKAKITDDSWTVSAGFADLDGDGHVDFYACRYVNWRFGSKETHPECTYDGKTPDVCPPLNFKPLPHVLYRNNGDGTFTDVSLSAGLRVPRTEPDYASLKKDYLAEAASSGRARGAVQMRLREEAYRRLRKAKGISEIDKPAADVEKALRESADKEMAALTEEALARETDKEVERIASEAIQRLRQADDPKEVKYGKGLGVLTVDVNLDGRPDIYVCNDTVDNFLYINRSHPGKILLEEVGLGAGVARDERGNSNGSMGVDAGDPLGTGRPSIWVTNYENELHALYLNDCRDGKVIFRYGTQLTGIAAIGQAYVGWGTRFIDLDRDGWEDLVISNGHAIRYPKGAAKRAEKPVLLFAYEGENGRRKFRDVSAQAGDYFLQEHVGRGVAFGDLDNDGRTDFVAAHLNQPTGVVQGIGSDTNHWLGLQLRRKDHRDLVGTRILIDANGRTQARFAKGGSSYASASDPRHVVGLGQAEKADRVRVFWPDGMEQVFEGLATGSYWLLIEGEKEPKKATQ